MDGQQHSSLEKFAPWLAGLNLVSTAERGLSIACWVLGGLVLLAMLVSIGWWQALLVVKAHAWLYLVVRNATPRPWTWRLLGLTVLSLTHVFAFALLSVPGLDIVAVIYFALALVVFARYYPQLGCAKKHLAEAQEFTTRDDFQWLVTTAPLATRMRLMLLVRNNVPATEKRK